MSYYKFMPKLTLEQKMHRPVQAEVKVLDRAFGGMETGQLMLISTPRDIEAAIQLIPEKSFISVPQLRRQLAISIKRCGWYLSAYYGDFFENRGGVCL